MNYKEIPYKLKLTIDHFTKLQKIAESKKPLRLPKYFLDKDTKRKLQAEIIEAELPKQLNKYALSIFLENDFFMDFWNIQIRNNLDAITYVINQENETNYNKNMFVWLGQNLNKANHARVKRIKERIESMILSDKAYFLTLTFTNEVLDKTSATTRRRYVARVLAEISTDYVANKDFGKTTEREHYHAVIETDQEPTLDNWIYGFKYIQKIGTTEQDIEKVAKYTSKLTFHAIKQTTKGERLIYPKRKN
jgi:hypothetical protein